MGWASHLMLQLLCIGSMTVLISAQDGMTGGGTASTEAGTLFIGRARITQTGTNLDVSAVGLVNLRMDLEAAYLAGTYGGLTPSRVIVGPLTGTGSGPFEADVTLVFSEDIDIEDQTSIFRNLRTNPIVIDFENVLGFNATLGLTVSLTCDDDTRVFAIEDQQLIEAFLMNCPCSTLNRIPSCSAMDITSIILDSLTATVDFLLNIAEQQGILIEQQGNQLEDLTRRLEILEALQLEDRLGALQDQIDELQGVDRNLTGSGMTVLESIQSLRNDLLVLQNQDRVIQSVNLNQDRRLEDLDSQSNIAWALGIAGTVFGSLGLALLISICVCLCCPGNRLPLFASPRPLSPACPPPPLCRPVINGPVFRRPMLPAPGNMARFGVGRMPAGPLYGGYCR